MIRTAAACLAVLVGCSDDGSGPVIIDGPKADNGVVLCDKPVVYLNFQGVTITKGTVDDSHLNITEAPAIPDAGFVVPPFANTAARDQLLPLIDRRLALLKIPAMHSRPTTGDYFMLVFVEEFLQGVQGGRSTTNCAHANPNTIGFLNTAFYSIHGNLTYAMPGAMLMIGRAAGLDPVDQGQTPPNCMVNDLFQAGCSFGQVTSTLGPCATGAQDQTALLDALACR